MALTKDELCVRYFERTVLPYLQQHCKLDAQHLEHNDGDNFAYIPLDALKDYGYVKSDGYVKSYNGIDVSVDAIYNPNIDSLNKRPFIYGCIVSSDGKLDNLNRTVFKWKSLVEMVYAVNLLRQMS